MFLQALNVVFEKIPENESADVCRNISVNVLDCDTIGQAKEKIFQAFLSKNGSPYGLQLNEIGLGKAMRELFCPHPRVHVSPTISPFLPAYGPQASADGSFLAQATPSGHLWGPGVCTAPPRAA